MIAWALLLGAIATFGMLATTAFSCMQISQQTRRIMQCQETVVSWVNRQDTSVSSDSSAHRPA
jgi:hypothetical protein